MNKNNLFAFYGSLRKGMYNYNGIKHGVQKEIKLGVEISGYKLFSLGSYPCIVETGNESDKLIVDLFELEPSTAYSIDRMEKGAGYKYKEITIDGKEFGIYVYPEEALNRLADKHVPSGDWVKHLQDRNAKVEI